MLRYWEYSWQVAPQQCLLPLVPGLTNISMRSMKKKK